MNAPVFLYQKSKIACIKTHKTDRYIQRDVMLTINDDTRVWLWVSLIVQTCFLPHIQTIKFNQKKVPSTTWWKSNKWQSIHLGFRQRLFYILWIGRFIRVANEIVHWLLPTAYSIHLFIYSPVRMKLDLSIYSLVFFSFLLKCN